MLADTRLFDTDENRYVVNQKGVCYVQGVLLGCRYGIPAMKSSGGGAIVNTASFVAFMGAATPQVSHIMSFF